MSEELLGVLQEDYVPSPIVVEFTGCVSDLDEAIYTRLMQAITYKRHVSGAIIVTAPEITVVHDCDVSTYKFGSVVRMQSIENLSGQIAWAISSYYIDGESEPPYSYFSDVVDLLYYVHTFLILHADVGVYGLGNGLELCEVCNIPKIRIMDQCGALAEWDRRKLKLVADVHEACRITASVIAADLIDTMASQYGKNH